MAEWDVVGQAPVDGINPATGRPRITVTPRNDMTPGPPTDPWAVQSTSPLTAKPGVPQDMWTPVAQEPIKPGLLERAAEPITSYFPTQRQLAREGVERMKEGVTEMGTPGERIGGAFKAATGALGWTLSPIDAAARTIVGKPVEDLTGIPKEWTEFATTLAIPGIGLASAGKGREALKPIERILSPTTVSPEAGEAAGALRAASGTAARDSETTARAVEPYYAKINAMPPQDRLNFMDYVEGRSGKYAGLSMRDPEMQAFANKLRDAFDLRMQKLQSLPSTAQASFVEDYFPHFWKDPQKAASMASDFGGGSGKQGSGASLHKRNVPTIADGIAMGLEPLSTNPIDATMRYVRSMDAFIAATEVLDTAVANGTVRYVKPRVMGASGHPESYKVPEGWVKINGRGGMRPDGAQAFAPADWARVYNNFIDRGIHKNADWGKVYDAMQSVSNSITALELGLSGYHAFTMANEAIISGVAQGISEIVGGKPIRALGTVAKAPAAPIHNYRVGKKVEQEYLGLTNGTPDMRRITELLEKAGGRAVGKGHASDYRFSAMGSYWTAFKRGALKQEMADAAANIKAQPVVGSVREGVKGIGRIMETVAQPLFEKYIPRIKNGAFYDTMKSWLDAHPQAGYDEQVKAARQIWDSIDNRFGEVVQDNIFWNKTLKQAAQLSMRSYSWNLGTVREIGGGVKDIINTVGRGNEWTPRASYVVALPIVVGTMNALYQKLMTGKNPESVDDLVAARTGGTAPGFGSRGEVPERAMTPGYQKDVLGWYHDWRQEAANKIATGPRAMIIDPLRNSDWKGAPVFHEGSPALADYFKHVIEAMGPISIKQIMQGRKKGSELGFISNMMGIRPAPAALQDPEGTARGLKAMSEQRERKEKRFNEKQKRLYEE